MGIDGRASVNGGAPAQVRVLLGAAGRGGLISALLWSRIRTSLPAPPDAADDGAALVDPVAVPGTRDGHGARGSGRFHGSRWASKGFTFGAIMWLTRSASGGSRILGRLPYGGML